MISLPIYITARCYFRQTFLDKNFQQHSWIASRCTKGILAERKIRKFKQNMCDDKANDGWTKVGSCCEKFVSSYRFRYSHKSKGLVSHVVLSNWVRETFWYLQNLIFVKKIYFSKQYIRYPVTCVLSVSCSTNSFIKGCNIFYEYN